MERVSDENRSNFEPEDESDAPPVGLNEFEHDLAEVMHDEFGGERLKMLFATVIAEFKTQYSNMALTEEEQQQFNNINLYKNDELLKGLKVFSTVGARNLNNQLIIGSNGDDLRTFIINAYQ